MLTGVLFKKRSTLSIGEASKHAHLQLKRGHPHLVDTAVPVGGETGTGVDDQAQTPTAGDAATVECPAREMVRAGYSSRSKRAQKEKNML